MTAARTPARAPAANVVGASPRGDHAARGHHVSPSHHPGAGPDHRPVVHHRAAAHHRHAAAARHHAAVRRASMRHYWAWRHHHHRPWWRVGWAWHPYPWWRPHWSYGVFYYGPRVVYVDGAYQEPAAEAVVPEREVDRARTFALGVRGGSYMGDYSPGRGYGDFGMGLALRYRATESLGLEFAWAYHDQTWAEGSERITQPFSASVELFAFPWTRVNPYALAGITWTARNWQDAVLTGPGQEAVVAADDVLFGPHGGVGIEFGVGRQASVNFEGRATGYLNRPDDDPTVPLALQGTMGMNFYF